MTLNLKIVHYKKNLQAKAQLPAVTEVNFGSYLCSFCPAGPDFQLCLQVPCFLGFVLFWVVFKRSFSIKKTTIFASMYKSEDSIGWISKGFYFSHRRQPFRVCLPLSAWIFA
jgi:hypothetical protein